MTGSPYQVDCEAALAKVDSEQDKVKQKQTEADVAAKKAEGDKKHAVSRAELLAKIKPAQETWEAARLGLIEGEQKVCAAVAQCEKTIKQSLGSDEACVTQAHAEYGDKVEERTTAERAAEKALADAEAALAAAQATLDILTKRFNDKYATFSTWFEGRTQAIAALMDKFKAELAKGDCRPERAYLLLLDAMDKCAALETEKDICLADEMLKLLDEIEQAQEAVTKAETDVVTATAAKDAASTALKQLTDDRLAGLMVLVGLCKAGTGGGSSTPCGPTSTATA